jgi:hypothetical protein
MTDGTEDLEPTFDHVRQAELARILGQLDARAPVDRAEVFARAARTLPPPPTVASVLATDAEPDTDG